MCQGPRKEGPCVGRLRQASGRADEKRNGPSKCMSSWEAPPMMPASFRPNQGAAATPWPGEGLGPRRITHAVDFSPRAGMTSSVKSSVPSPNEFRPLRPAQLRRRRFPPSRRRRISRAPGAHGGFSVAGKNRAVRGLQEQCDLSREAVVLEEMCSSRRSCVGWAAFAGQIDGQDFVA